MIAPKQAVTPYGWLAYAVALAVIGVDQLSKFWILAVFDLPNRGSVAVTPLFNLSMVWNRGVSFGLLRADAEFARWGLAVFALAVAVALAIWARRTQRTLSALAFGLIIGGALGNLIDRVRFGAVVDFIDVGPTFGRLFPWVFNVADCGVSVGVALILLESVLPQRKG